MLFNSSNDRIKKRIRNANNLFDTFEREASLREFLNLQQEFPENTDILFALAVVQNSMRQQVLAIETFKCILRINSSHQDTLSILPTVIYEYGVRLKESGDIDLARQYFLDFIGLDNGNKIDLANGYKELALIEESFGNADKAKKYIRTAMDIVSSLEESEYLSNYKDYYKEIDERINGG
jgi:tetratricopeptide (TPR) repeat protein